MNVTIEYGFDAIGRAAWDALVEQDEQAGAMHGWAWQLAWWETFRGEPASTREPWFVVARDAGRPVGLAPLFLDRRDSDGRRTLRLIGDGALRGGRFLCAGGDTRTCAALLEAVAERADAWDAIELSELRKDSSTATTFGDWATRRGWSQRWSGGHAIHVIANGATSAHDEMRGDASGLQVDFAEGSAEAEALLPALFGLHIQETIERGERSAFVDRRHRDFVRRLARAEGPDGVVLASVACEGRIVACELLGHVGSSMSSLAGGVDPLAPRGAKRRLAEGCVAFARERGMRSLVLRAPLPDHHLGQAMTHACASVRITRTSGSTRVLALMKHAAPVRAVRTVADEASRLTRVLFRGPAIVAGRRRRAATIASHREFYDADATTALYRRQTSLQPPERTILTELRPMLRDARILDVGVGAGRTVPYFATLGRHYHAFDYAEQMVEHCRSTSGDLVSPSQIVCDDARQMQSVATGAFDFVLISYNGIDSVGGETDRLRVLAEVRRVAAPGAMFCFSSHNLQSVTPRGGAGVVERMRRWRRHLMLRAANPGLGALRRQPNAMLFDVGSEYAFAHYYITPHAQARQLESVGYRDVRVFSVDSGREVTDRSQWTRLLDSWVYYLCRI